jgi:hypothetical protein
MRLKVLVNQRRSSHGSALFPPAERHCSVGVNYLLSQGERVMHILGTAHVDEQSLTPGPIVCGDGRIIYPAEIPRLG